MKTLLTILICLFSFNSWGQTTIKKNLLIDTSESSFGRYVGIVESGSIYSNFIETDLILRIRYDTTILNVGDVKCNHHYASKDVRNGMYSDKYGYMCAVWHGITGCPYTWYNTNYICTICLRHFNIKEYRWTEKKPNEYDETLKRLQSKTKQP